MTHTPTISRLINGRFLRIGLILLMTVVIASLASCSSNRVGISHNYDSPFGSGTIYLEGSDHGHRPKKPKKPKKPKHKKPKKKDKRHHD